MADAAKWRPISLVRRPGFPNLLISLSFGLSSYSVHLTDLAHVWSEQLDRRSICMRGWKENTSIDPSDTPENMTKFLFYLESALGGPQPPADSAVSVRLSSQGFDAGPDGLTLTITHPVPGYTPLRWPMFMARRAPPAVSTELLLPLIQAQAVQIHQVHSLVDLLQQKDVVITKLLDKVESSGIGLENVFTTLAGKRKITRAIAEEKIRALVPFKPNAGGAGAAALNVIPANYTDLLATVFGVGLLYRPGQADILPLDNADSWWRNRASVEMLSASGPALSSLDAPLHPIAASDQAKREPSTAGAQEVEAPPDVRLDRMDDEDDEDDEFQVQRTPPRLATSREPTRPPVPVILANNARETETESEDDEDIPKAPHPPRRSPTPLRLQSPQTAPEKREPLDGPDDENDFQVQLAPPRLATSKKTARPPVYPSQRVEEDDRVGPAKTSRHSPVPPLLQPPQAAPQKKSLGTIGGRKMEIAAGTEREVAPPQVISPISSHTVSSPGPQPAPGPTVRKLGKIGKQSAVPTDDTERGRPPADPVDTRRELSADRADRRREELKREREQKITAGPKKKRRF